MRKLNALLFVMLFVIVTVCCPNKAVPQPEGASLSPELLSDSKALALTLNECKRHAGTVVGHEVGDLQKRLGKEMTPRDTADVSTMLRIADECTAYLSSPSLVSGMELPAAQDARREANNTIQRLNELSRTVTGKDLQSLTIQTREHLQTTTSTLSATTSIRQDTPIVPSFQNVSEQQSSASSAAAQGRPSETQMQSILGFDKTIAAVERSAMQNGITLAGVLKACENSGLMSLSKIYGWNGQMLDRHVASLESQLGKNLMPRSISDVSVLNEVFLQYSHMAQLEQAREAFRTWQGSREYRDLLFDQARADDFYSSTERNVTEAARRRREWDVAKAGVLAAESALDRHDLQDAHLKLTELVNDNSAGTFLLVKDPLSGFSPVQRYLELTAQLRNDLSDYVVLKNASRPSSMSLVQELDLIGQEHRRLTSLDSEPLTSELLKSILAADRADLTARIEASPSVHFDKSTYTIPVQFLTTTHSNEEAKATFLRDKLTELGSKLAPIAEIRKLIAQPSLMDEVAEQCGIQVRMDLEAKVSGIEDAEKIQREYNESLSAVQYQIQSYRAKEEAEEKAKNERLAEIQRLHDQVEARKQAIIAERSNLAGTIWNEVLMITMLDEKFRLTEVMGYTIEAQKQRTQLNNLLRRDSSLLTPSLWAEVDRNYQQMLPGLTVWRATHSQSIIEELRSSAR
jgi:hypothetical protein